LDSSDAGKKPMMGCCKNCDELSCAIKFGEFHEWLNNIRVLNRNMKIYTIIEMKLIATDVMVL
jgi:hypothetical protein